MILSHDETGGERRGVVTNGIGQPTTAHLNLTRSLADVWGLTEKEVAEARHVRYPPPREIKTHIRVTRLR